LASCIVEGYQELFALYPEANAETDNNLRSFFATKTTGAQQVIAKTTSTFKALCSQADFKDLDSTPVPSIPSSQISAPTETTQAAPAPGIAAPVSNPPNLHIDVNIHIAADAKPEQIEKIFESMAKHLGIGKS